jgi:hypothetical protein
MQLKEKTKCFLSKRVKTNLAAFAVLSFIITIPELSFAGEAAKEFDGALTRLTNIIEGQGGRTAGAVAVLFAVVGSVLRFNPAQIAGAVGVGLAAGYGVGVVNASVTALI